MLTLKRNSQYHRICARHSKEVLDLLYGVDKSKNVVELNAAAEDDHSWITDSKKWIDYTELPDNHIETVKESLRDAQEDLRNALAAAARTEKPFVSKHIADMLAMIDNIIDASEMLEKLENRKEGDSGFFGTFFNGDLK